jgi:hypothetical protein
VRLYTVVEDVPLELGEPPLACAARYAQALEARGVPTLLRWGAIGRTPSSVTLECGFAEGALSPSTPPATPAVGVLQGETSAKVIRTAIVIPTGVGAAMGGFIADAGPFVRAVESVSDLTVVHPNVVNGADFNPMGQNTLYVDGLTLDYFLLGRTRLGPVPARRIGLILEPMPQPLLSKLLNAANAVRAIYGIDIVAYDLLDRPLEATVRKSQLGHYSGEVGDASGLLRSAERLQRLGADALAVVTQCGGVANADWQAHYLEGGPNPIGGLESLISRFLTRATGMPAAHAPAQTVHAGLDQVIVDPRAAGEVASGSGLPCILIGLAQAPIASPACRLGVEDLSAVIVPFGAAGGVPMWGALQAGTPLLAIRSNTCAVGLSVDKTGVAGPVVVETPADALAWLISARSGTRTADAGAGRTEPPPRWQRMLEPPQRIPALAGGSSTIVTL